MLSLNAPWREPDLGVREPEADPVMSPERLVVQQLRSPQPAAVPAEGLGVLPHVLAQVALLPHEEHLRRVVLRQQPPSGGERAPSLVEFAGEAQRVAERLPDGRHLGVRHV
jgi:hypothetical protein